MDSAKTMNCGARGGKTQATALLRVAVVWMVVAGITACSMASPGPNPVLRPKPNPKAKHWVVISGRVPASLNIAMSASYLAGNSKGRCEPTLRTKMIPIFGENWEGMDLKIKRQGDRYETRFLADRFLPGECGWRFQEINARIGEQGKPLPRWAMEDPVVANWGPQTSEDCHGKGGPGCPAVTNSEPTPAIVRCKLFESDDPNEVPDLLCPPASRRKAEYKQTHLFTSEVRRIEVNFYNLSSEPDPVPDAPPEPPRAAPTIPASPYADIVP